MDERYKSWNIALVEEYFPDRAGGAGHLAYLPIDDDELKALAASAEVPEGVDPVEDFVAAVTRELHARKGSFLGFAAMARGWRSVSDVPTYVAGLALCVLAASRMEVDRDAGVASHNYYVQLNRLLGREERAGAPSGFESLRDAWDDLSRWLDEDCGGRRGASTIRTGKRHVNIGYPLSQCLLRAADRRRLPDFFVSQGLEPRSEISDRRLFVLLQAWASKPSCGLTSRARHSIASATDTDRDEIAETVGRELATWDGELRDKAGRRRLSMRLLLVPRKKRIDLSLLAPVADGAAVGRWRIEGEAGPTGDHVEVTEHPYAAGWFAPLDIPVTAKILSRGLTLVSGEFSMVYERSDAVPFSPAPIELNGLLSKPQASLEDRNVVLITDGLFSEVAAYLRHHVDSPIERYRSNDASALPPGWSLTTEFSFRSLPPEAPDHLSRLRPRQQVTTSLRGGLKLGRDTYLTGGEPDAQVSSVDTAMLSIELDGEPKELREGEFYLPLSEAGLGAGRHELRADVVRRFVSVDSFGEVSPRDAGTIAHRLSKRSGGYVPTTTAATEGTAELGHDEISVAGAVADSGTRDSLPIYGQRPTLIRSGGLAYVLLGRTTAQFHRVTNLEPPEWLTIVGLREQYQFIECRPPFEPAWLLVVQSSRKRTVKPLSVPPLACHRDPEHCAEWTGSVIAWRDADVEDGAFDVWQSMVRMAEELRSEGDNA